MPDFKAELAGVIGSSHDELLKLARQVLDDGDLVTTTPDDQLDQLVRATEAIFLEGLEGGSDTRTFVIETAIPAYADAGETAATIAATSVTFAVLVSSLLCSRVSDANRDEAQRWLATFYGAYVGDIIKAMDAPR